MKKLQCLPIILLAFSTAFGQEESGIGLNQHFWLLDGFEFPDARFIRNSFTEANLNNLTIIIDSRAYAGAGIQYGNFDENLKTNFNSGSKEIFYLKNRCYLDCNKLTEQLPGLLKKVLPSACHFGFSCQRDKYSEKIADEYDSEYDDCSDGYDDESNGLDGGKQNGDPKGHQTVSNFSIAPNFFFYWIFSKSIVNNIRFGIQRTFHRYDPSSEEIPWPDHFEYFLDMYLGKHDNTRNLFRLTFNTINDNEEEWNFKYQTDYFCLEYEFQHDFEFNLSVNIGVKAEYLLYKATDYPPSPDDIFKLRYVELMPHLSVDYTFPVFLNTISFSIYIPRLNNLGWGDEDKNIWDGWEKYWSASIYLSMPFWSKPLNIKTTR